MRVFKHLTITDRLRIEKWKKEGMRTREIAEKLRVNPSTVYRELKRGSYDRLNGTTWELIPTYSPDIAEQKYQAHLREKGPGLKIGKDHELAAYIENTIIEKDCSPAAVYGYAMEEGRTFKTHISIPTVYSYIKKGVFLNLTQKALPRHGIKKNEYQKIKKKGPAKAPAGESIEKRPEEVKTREEFGHWEMDTVYSGKNKSTVALLVLTERKTRNENIILIPNRRAETTVRALDALERKLGAEKFGAIYKSITVDNGTEFAMADEIEKSCLSDSQRTKVYYCHPYSSWERGSNENVNGMIRRRRKMQDLLQSRIISRLIPMASILPAVVGSVAGPAPARPFRECSHYNNNRLPGLCRSLLISKKPRGTAGRPASIFRYPSSP